MKRESQNTKQAERLIGVDKDNNIDREKSINNMLSVAILTGAGASRALDYPTTNEFFEELTTSENNSHNQILTRLRQQLGTNQLDVEDVLSMLDPIEDMMQTPSGRFISPNINDAWLQKTANFSKLCRDRCFQLYGRHSSHNDVKEIYLPLLEALDCKNNKLSLFTTNYDPVTDTLMEVANDLGIQTTDGFTNLGKWFPKNYDRLIKGINIFRLHGSMSWIKREGQIINTRDYTLRLGNTKHLLIYPGYKGNPENDTEEAYSYPHIALRNELNNTNFFIAIGFAFRDKHINNIINSAMKKNSKLELIVINPEFPKGEDNFLVNLQKRGQSRIHHISNKFGDEKLSYDITMILSGKKKLKAA